MNSLNLHRLNFDRSSEGTRVENILILTKNN